MILSTSKNALRFLALCAIAGLVACASGGGSPAPLSSVVAGCTSVAPPQLIYPAPSMTSVPTNIQIYVSYATNPAQAFAAPVVTGGGATIVSSWYAGTPSPGPTPTGSVNPTQGPEWLTNGVTLARGTNYNIYVTNNACNQTYSLGSFATQ